MKNTNNELYRDLFAKASEVLSGYERTQTFDEDNTYFYKDSKNNSFIELIFNSADKEGKIYEFADALTQYGYLYTSNGKNPADYNFVPELGITTLEEYYNWLPEIKATVVKDKDGNPVKDENGNVVQQPTIFTKLPLDEPHFEINPNTRAIIIPPEFKKNGIAVQGDDLAEVVYFMIDRFFDAMDLNNTDIYIEWETPKGKTGSITKSVSETYLKIIDDENYPGKLIFGWAISDAITKDSGTLKFSVRFVQWNEQGKLVYSFNTLTAQATIHPNLGLDLENDNYKIDNCNDRLLDRIEPSEVVGGAKAAIPYFIQNIVVLEDGYDIKDNHTTGTYDLSVIATADDTGVVTYVWKRSEIGADAWFEIPNSSEKQMVLLDEKDLDAYQWKLPESHIYHLDRADGTYYLLPKGYYDLTDANTIAWFERELNVNIKEGDIPKIYEQRSILTVEKYGEYKAEARNRIFNSLTKTSSNIALFKTPEPVVMDNEKQTTNKHIVGAESATLTPKIVEEVGDLTYQWFKADEMDVLSQRVSFNNLPPASRVSYGEEVIRIMCPKDAVYSHQNVGTGGDKNKYYIGMNLFAPEGAVSFREGECGLNPADEMPELEPMVKLEDAPHGVDSLGRTYRARWIPVAYYDETTDTWNYYAKNKGANEYVGWKTEIVWFDADGVELERTFMKIQLANEINYGEVTAFEPISGEGANEASYTATEPGLYKMEVTRIRNRASTIGDSLTYRVTNAPAVPAYAEGIYDGKKLVSINDLRAGTETLKVEWDNDIDSDEFYIAWFLYRGDQGDPTLPDLPFEVQKVSNVYSATFNPTDSHNRAILEAAGENVEGAYYAIIKNKLNGVESAYSEIPAWDKMFVVLGS